MVMELFFSFATYRPGKNIRVAWVSRYGNGEVLDVGMAESAQLLPIDVDIKVHFLPRHNVLLARWQAAQQVVGRRERSERR